MKTKLFFLAALLAALSGSLFAQTPVKNLFGSGTPNANLASVVGTTYIDQSTSPATMYTCTAVTQTATLSQCTWTADGSAGAAFSKGFIDATNSSQVSPPVKGTGATYWGCTFVNGNTSITCTDGNFTSANVGMIVFGTNGCCGGPQQIASILEVPQGTVTSVTNSTTIVVSVAPTANVSPPLQCRRSTRP